MIPVRALNNRETVEFGNLQFELIHQLEVKTISQRDAQYAVAQFWAGAMQAAAIEGDVTGGSPMAGQSVGLVDQTKPVKGIFEELLTEAESEMQRLRQIMVT